MSTDFNQNSFSIIVEAKFDFRRLAQAATDKPQTGAESAVKDVEAQVTRLSAHPFPQFK